GDRFVERIDDAVVSRENNVRLVLAKVVLGEADAAIVYQTDARSTDDVRAIPIPDDLQVDIAYPIAVLRDAAHGDEAAAFVAFVRSEQGQEILKAHGFSGVGP